MNEYIIAYDKESGIIHDILKSDQCVDVYFKRYPSDLLNNIKSLHYEGDLPEDINMHYIKDGKLTKYSANEYNEITTYGRLLSEGERRLIDLRPLRNEVEKAEQTIEILSLIQEVM